MAKKKSEPIKALCNEDKLTVQKSLPLFALWQSELTLSEFKILDTYLARINSHNPKQREVVFEKGELENLLGVKKINNKELQERLKHLMGNVVEIPDISSRKGFRLISLFEEAVAEQDDYGFWQIKLECTQKAMKYIFNMDNLGYLRYKLRCITSITSRYTYIMFIYLESNRFRKTWEVPLMELKEILNCTADRYKEFKYFRTEVLARVQKEMHEKTECKYDYEPIKKGRSVVAIRFTLETLPRTSIEDIDPDQLTLEEYSRDISKELWISALEKNGEKEFSEEQIDEIREVLVTIPEYKLPEDNVTQMNDIQFRRYHYIAQQYAALNRIASKNKINNRFLYFMKMLRSDTSLD